ncbi:hypothetical protein, partial [Streptomyces sp. wa22]|uniref:hypothetical protein n=1 Tax=Streptomyces sp. wa22 TaxID=1828244 RepID=UPI001C9C32F3
MPWPASTPRPPAAPLRSPSPSRCAVTSTWRASPAQPVADARRTAGNTNNLNGKILRIHPEDDGTYT